MKIIGFGSVNRKIAGIYNAVTSSIAFYPVIITMAFLVLVVLMLWFDYSNLAADLRENMRWLQFKEMETVRAILTTLIGGIISLMALSFSMVMVVLNQATTTVSPKVMQGLVTKKQHQFVLGNQFGSILYFMVVLLLLRGIEFYKIPTFSVALGLLLGFWSLGLFVYFIHSISQSIQVTNIIANIHLNTSQVLKDLARRNEKEPIVPTPKLQLPYLYPTDKAGFLQEINVEKLLKIACKYNLQMQLEPYFTEYIPTGGFLFSASLPPEKIEHEDLQQVYSNILYFNSEHIDTNHIYGFTQLSEIAVKSLSPGINDPGIAVICLQYLADLFMLLYPIREKEVYLDAENKPRIIIKNIGFDGLLTLTLSPIRSYGKNDMHIIRALLNLLLLLGQRDQQHRKYQELLNQHTEAVLSTIKDMQLMPADVLPFNTVIEKMQQINPPYFSIRKIVVHAE